METSAAPAGLTAKARSKARPEAHSAKLPIRVGINVKVVVWQQIAKSRSRMAGNVIFPRLVGAHSAVKLFALLTRRARNFPFRKSLSIGIRCAKPVNETYHDPPMLERTELNAELASKDNCAIFRFGHCVISLYGAKPEILEVVRLLRPRAWVQIWPAVSTTEWPPAE